MTQRPGRPPGGGPGLMQAANEGALSTSPEGGQRPARSMGINIELPFEQSVNPYVDAAFAHSTFFSRLHHLVLLSDAFVVVPDGIGSLLEMSLAWQLLQVHQLHNTPLIVCGEMWEDLIDWSRGAMGQPGNELASAEDFDIPKSVETIDQAVAIIRENREKWLASRSGE